MTGFEQYTCVLCLTIPSKKCDINFLDSNQNLLKELDDLPFSITFKKSICKACLVLLNKRRSFKERLCELDKTITNVHQLALNVIGLSLTIKRNAARKLGFEQIEKTSIFNVPDANYVPCFNRNTCPMYNELEMRNRLVFVTIFS